MSAAARSAPARDGAFRQAGLYALGLALSRSTGFVLLPLVTHVLPPPEFGRLEFLSSIVSAGVLIGSTWLLETLFRFGSAPGAEGERAAADVSGLGFVVAGAILLLSLAAAPVLAGIMPVAASAQEMALAGLLMAAEVTNNVQLGLIRMRNRARRWAMLTVGRMLLHLALAALLLWAGFGVAGVLAAGATASLLVALLLAIPLMRGGGIALAPARWKPLLMFGLPLTPSGVAVFVFASADLWFLAGHVPTAELGIYALAARMALIASLATQPFDLWWYPRRLAVLREENGVARTARLAGFGAALGLVCAAAAAVLGPLLVLGLTPAGYHAATLLIPWMAAALAIQTFGIMLNAGCYVGHSGATAGSVNIGAALLALVLYGMLIPRFGVAGAIAATLLAQTLRMAAFVTLSLRRAPVPYPFGSLFLVAVGCALTAATLPVLGLNGLGFLAGFLAFGGCLLLAGMLRLTPSGRRPV